MSVGLVRLAAIVLFMFSGMAAFGWGVHWSHSTALGLDSAGLFCYALSFFSIPQPPP